MVCVNIYNKEKIIMTYINGPCACGSDLSNNTAKLKHFNFGQRSANTFEKSSAQMHP
jgi:hypothetical protein